MEGLHHCEGQVAVAFQQRPFAQGLGVRIDIRPAEGLSPGLAQLDHAVLSPLGSQLLGPFGQERDASGAQFGTSGRPQPGQLFRVAAGRFGVRTGPPGGINFVPP